MLGPTPNSLGTMGLDFFQHGGVAFGGAGNVFGVVKICLAASFSVAQALNADFDVNKALAADFTTEDALSANFNVEQDLDASVQKCV